MLTKAVTINHRLIAILMHQSPPPRDMWRFGRDLVRYWQLFEQVEDSRVFGAPFCGVGLWSGFGEISKMAASLPAMI